MIEVNWQNNVGFFYTYYGEVFYGIARQIPSQSSQESFYIINKKLAFELSNKQDRNFYEEQIIKYGKLIKNRNIISFWINEFENKLARVSHQSIPSIYSPKNYKSLYVFGAGASANCTFGKGIPELKSSMFKPPLGNELFSANFDQILKDFPLVKNAIPIYESRNNDIENILQDEWNLLINKRNELVISQHIQVQFYLQQIFKEISDYVTQNHFRHNLYNLFVKKLFENQKDEFYPSIVSFNYDTLLDFELEKYFNHKFETFSDYIFNNEYYSKFAYFKLHGSHNWGFPLIHDKFNSMEHNSMVNLLSNRDCDLFRLYFEYLGKPYELSYIFEQNNDENYLPSYSINLDKMEVMSDKKKYFPSILLPYSDKDEFILPLNLHTNFNSILPYVEDLFLIGWKGNESYFNQKLVEKTQNLRRIIIVNPNLEEVLSNIPEKIKNLNLEQIHINTFEEFVFRMEELI